MVMAEHDGYKKGLKAGLNQKRTATCLPQRNADKYRCYPVLEHLAGCEASTAAVVKIFTNMEKSE